MRDELSINSGLLLKGTRVCLPPELLNCTPADLHGAHHGINRMQAQVKEAVYWPSIDADIANYVSAPFALNTKPLPLNSPCFLGMFLMVPGRRFWQITSPTRVSTTYYSAINSASAPSCTRSPPSLPSLCVHLLKLISQYGPSSLFSGDNGQPFTSEEPTHFLQHHHIEHSSSSPHFPRSNGFTECQVRTLKTALSTGQDSHKTLENVLLDL